MDEFFKKTRRDLSPEELANIRLYQASAGDGKVVFQPVIRGLGDEVDYQARVYIRGASGPVRLTRQALRRIGAPSEWFEKSQTFLKALQSHHPQLPGEQARPALEGDTPSDEGKQA